MAEGRLLTIVNTRGLHARASAKFVQCTEKFDADVKVSKVSEGGKEGTSVSGTSIMGLDALEALVVDGFGERD